MNEGWFWSGVRDAFKGIPHARIKKLPAEGFGGKGTPDGAYVVGGIQGFLELKYTEWPKRTSTPIKVGDHGVSPEQRIWLEQWEECGGRVHVLLGVGHDWYLLRIDEVPQDNRISREDLAAVREDGRAGKTKTLNELPRLLAAQVPPTVYWVPTQ